MKIENLDDKLQTISTMLDVMNKVKSVYFPEREEKDEIVRKAHKVLVRELDELGNGKSK